MIKAEELRIGNLVWHPIHGVGEVESISNHSILIKSNYDPLVLPLFNPIPLTEEWLLKFGFEYLADAQYWKTFKNLNFNWDKECGLYVFLETQEDNIQTEHIKHVHQLQNLYHALTGEKLKIKE
tara:strand:+ start:3349 stop:3720 length:372 start_codon:yes stop_codon:yes gene_type:complete